nr:MAG TPA: hypothetical protein [Caudoviricetes sp.]
MLKVRQRGEEDRLRIHRPSCLVLHGTVWNRGR